MNLEEVKSRAGGLLAPVPGGEPAGQNASFDPRYEQLRTTMASLDSPSGGSEVEWPTVVASGEELLRGTSKDLLVASYTTYAMLQVQGLPGLATGLQAIIGLLEQYWDTMFPPAKRMRGRGNALDWLVTRLEVALSTAEIQPSDRPLVELIQTQWKTLGEKSRDRLADHAPSMRGVEEVLERTLLNLPQPAAPPAPAPEPEPAPAPAPEAAAAPTPEPAPAPTPEPAPAPAPAPAGAEPPAESGPAADSPQPTNEAPPAPEPAAPPAPPDPTAELTAKAQPWLEPIPGDAPAGAEPRFEADYEAAKAEIAKLDSMTAGAPEWADVAKHSEAILKTVAKDILMAGYFAFARYQELGLAELPLGLAVLEGTIDQYWDGVFPTRARGRGNAAAWILGQLDYPLEQEKLQPKDRPLVLSLQAIWTKLAATLRTRMEDHAPGTREITERIQRMLLAVPEKRPEPPKPPPPTPTATAAAPTPAQPRPAAPAAPMPGVADVGNAEEVDKFLRDTGRAVTKAAQLLRAAQATSPAAFRLLRTGLWMHLHQPPPADAGGKTQIPPLDEEWRKRMETMLANKHFAAVLDETEGTLLRQRFNLDIQRLSWSALDGLGETGAAAKAVVVSELRAFLFRMPSLPDLTSGDGTPLADDQTRSWLDENVLTSGGGGGGGGSTGGADDAADVDAMRPTKAAIREKPADAMKLARAAIDSATSDRSRFIRQLTLAEICLGAGQAILARGIFAGLDRELRDRGLTEWESALSGRCLEGFVRAIRAAAKAGSNYDGADEVFERLCMVDPGAAAKLAG